MSILDPNELKIYRRMSSLSFLSKELKKVVLAQVFSHLNIHNLISEYQSAYSPGYSTETALLKVASDLLTAMDTGKVSVLTVLDLSAAFDIIDHAPLGTHFRFPGNNSSDSMVQVTSFRQNTDSVYRWETILPSYHLLWHSSRFCTWSNSLSYILNLFHM